MPARTPPMPGAPRGWVIPDGWPPFSPPGPSHAAPTATGACCRSAGVDDAAPPCNRAAWWIALPVAPAEPVAEPEAVAA